VSNLTSLGLLRAARQLTQNELSTLSGLSQAWISNVEAGAVDMTADRAKTLASLLGCTSELLLSTVHTLPIVHHRKRKSMPSKLLASFEARLHLAGIYGDPLLTDANVPIQDISFELTSFDEPEEAATDFRERSGIEPDAPVSSVIEVLERIGAIVVSLSFSTSKIDALSTRCSSGRLVMLVNTDVPARRSRFTMAHELGHAVMHHRPTDSPEEEADRFASEFLMPTTAVRQDLRAASLGSIDQASDKWGVSRAAVVRRARDLGEVDDRSYRSLNIELKRFPANDKTPNIEQSSLMNRTLEALVEAQGWSAAERMTFASRNDLEELLT